MNMTLDAGSGRRSRASVTLPRIKTPRGSLMSWVALTAPLVHCEFVLLDQVRLAAGREGAEGVAFGGGRVHGEPSLIVGAELGGEDSHWHARS